MTKGILVRWIWLTIVCGMAGGVPAAQATNVQLNLTVNETTSTWTVAAVASDAQQLGLASWSIDVNGIGGVSIQKASTAAQTNQAPFNVFSQLRTTGTISGSNLVDIQAAQDYVDAVNNNDDSGASGGTALVYGYGFNGTASGQYTSNNYGIPGSVVGQGPIVLAMGRYTGDIFLDGPGEIIAMVTPGRSFNFFPLNWDPNNFPTQGTTNLVSVVVFSTPEPASLVLLGLGGLGIAAFVRRCRTA
jgi:hypothetical protein